MGVTSFRIILAAAVALLQTAAPAQTISISVNLSNPSPFINSLTKHALAEQVADTLVESINRELRDFAPTINAVKRGDPAATLPHYMLNLTFVDTLVHVRTRNNVPFLKVYATFLEDHGDHSVSPSSKVSGASYKYDEGRDTISENDARITYFHMARVAAHSILRDYLPLSLTRTLPSKNKRRNLLTAIPYYHNIMLDLIVADSLSEEDPGTVKIKNMIKNIFLRKQVFYANAKSQKAYFNYYETKSVAGSTELYDHQIRISFVISQTVSGYRVELLSNDHSIKIDPSHATLDVDKNSLEKYPSIFNGKISNSIASFLFQNL